MNNSVNEGETDWMGQDIVKGGLKKVTAESIFEAVKAMDRPTTDEELKRVGCVVIPIDDFPELPVFHPDKGPTSVYGYPFVDILKDRYIFHPEFYERIMNYSMDDPKELPFEWMPADPNAIYKNPS